MITLGVIEKFRTFDRGGTIWVVGIIILDGHSGVIRVRGQKDFTRKLPILLNILLNNA